MPVNEECYTHESYITVTSLAEKDLGFRRVQCTGRGSYIISLPKEWVEDIGLKRGSEIAFNIQPDNSLSLVPRKILEKEGKNTVTKQKEYVINIDPKEPPEVALRLLRALYAIGADIIHIHFKNVKDTTNTKPKSKTLYVTNSSAPKSSMKPQTKSSFKSLSNTANLASKKPSDAWPS